MYGIISKKKYVSRPITRSRTKTRSKTRSKSNTRSSLLIEKQTNFNELCAGIIAPTSGETYTESVLAVIIDILGVVVDDEITHHVINGAPIKRHKGYKDAEKKARHFISKKPDEAFLINITYDDGGVHFLSYNPLFDKEARVAYNPYDYHQIKNTNQFCQTFALIHLLGLEQELGLQIAHNPKRIPDQKKYVANAYIAMRYGVDLIRRRFGVAQQTFELTKGDTDYGLFPATTLEQILHLAELILARHSNTGSEFRDWVIGTPYDIDNPRRSTRRRGHY